MPLNCAKMKLVSYGLMGYLLSACFHPPYNQFRPDHGVARSAATGASIGTVVGAVSTSTVGGTVIGAAVGGTVGALVGIHKESKPQLIMALQKEDIQYVAYGDTMTLIVPTDKYFMFNSPRLNELAYPGLINIIKLLNFYPKSPIYVAAFTDNVGSRLHKKQLSQAQAETMLTYLWANNIHAKRLKAEGYSDKNDVSDNHIIHGSAQNRRIEIQWFTGVIAHSQAPVMYTK